MSMKKALVIGNDSHEQNKTLLTCVNDANDMHDALQTIGFSVLCKTNQRLDDMKIATNAFIQCIQPGDIAFFYFSGHASQLDGINYLTPTDDRGITLRTIKYRTLIAQKLIHDVYQRRPGLFIIVLDCCRTGMSDDSSNLKSFFGLTSKRIKDGLAPMQAPPSTIISYACAPDQASLAGSSKQHNSAYTCFLLSYIVLPMDIKKVFQRTAIDVQKSTRGEQIPYLNVNCYGPAYIVDNCIGYHAAAQNFLQRRRPCGYYPASDQRRHAIPSHQPRIKNSQYRWNTQFGMPKNYHSSNKIMLPIYLRYTPEKWHKYYIWDCNWKKFIIGLSLSLGYYIYLLNLSYSTALRMFSFSFHSFISLFALLFSLFVTCTGLPLLKFHSTKIIYSTKLQTLIWITLKNVLFLTISIILCNLIGTLAASVLLFPPFISQNSSRLNHLNTQRFLIIFFIILIGNSAGLISPLGDPPLYMGYTNGVEFLFTFKYLYKIFFVSNGYILLLFALIDFINAWNYKKAQKKNNINSQLYELVPCQKEENDCYNLSSSLPIQWNGIHHSFFLLLILIVILCKGFDIPIKWPEYIQELILFLIAFLCIAFDMIWKKRTPIEWFRKHYSTRIEPVAEVIAIFVGLLFTMSAPIAVLTSLKLPLGPKHLFVFSGIFASVLDNAPVYISFAASAAARYNITVEQSDNNGFLAVFFSRYQADAIESIRAISAGSVLMGGCTLIGNAPNMIVALMATRYSYRKRTKIHRAENADDDFVTDHLENISFIRSLITSCLILIPLFVIITIFMV
ncbi:unnamed protein product [Rotaria magnacalcarata]|uniref:Caspase family p20 domain-containing protein n=1 Tax=Rotaria magnacalcarata TaxID=392030 RepID=A0A819ZD14_9BILA|nr:unnamed protein product [Rotaria magnacalcarata]